MKADKYIAQESFTAPTLCVVMTAWCIWAGCTEGWNILSVGGLVFFAIGMVVYIFKYVKYGRRVFIIFLTRKKKKKFNKKKKHQLD